MDPVYVINLSPVDKIRIVFTNMDVSSYIGLLAPYIRKNVEDGQLFTISDDPQGRCFRYIIKDGQEYISNDRGLIPLSKSRSLTRVLMDKLGVSEFTRRYDELKNDLTLPFSEQFDQ